MASRRWRRRLGSRAVDVLGKGLVTVVFGLAVIVPLSFIGVEKTAQPQFCNSCHIMEPYYESWQRSSHSNVPCIDCHYEPGSLEVVTGKFKALSQLAKYITRTEGTRPWAEVSDQSCMRSGCHTVRMLEGPLEFGRVKFDHRHHLLESRRGRRLRCVTCHSQIVQGEHLTVTDKTCYMCHFMPGSDPEVAAPMRDCLLCHGPPQDAIDVAGRPFEHREYLERGVTCQQCHDPVVEGEGTVRRERCHSCHAEVGHIERYGETEFLHEAHVTNHKVECFECHDEIRHGLLPLEMPTVASQQGCGTCHVNTHDANRMLYAGTGAIGVEDRPSRMFETRVVCEACHTGRTGHWEVGRKWRAPQETAGSSGVHADAARGAIAPGHAQVAAAGEVDCLHCHGTSYAGMLGQWQEAVTGQLERLVPLLEGLEEQVEVAAEPAKELIEEARFNVDLVRLDGSHGVHNVDYALETLQAAAERMDRAARVIDPQTEVAAAAGFPFVSELGCSACHVGVEGRPTLLEDGRSFPHGSHLAQAGMDCDACHQQEPHGALSLAPTDCASCHHEENDAFDTWDCARCHQAQDHMLRGSLEGRPETATSMGEMECAECHGEPGMVMRPAPRVCVLCHESGYDQMMLDWKATVDERLATLEPLLRDLEARQRVARQAEAGDLLVEARAALEQVQRDGSGGAHNVQYAVAQLETAAQQLEQARQLLAPEVKVRATEGFPFQSEHGCTVCHLGVERRPAGLDSGRPFSHQQHVVVESLDCDACHSIEEHGQPAASRQCTSCHHSGSAAQEEKCVRCHEQQDSMLQGLVEGFDEMPGTMVDLDCTIFHGEAPDIHAPDPQHCVICHGPGYGKLIEQWAEEVAGLRARVAEALATAADRGVPVTAIESARRALEAVDHDGSRGSHNFEFYQLLLNEALRLLQAE